VQNFWNDPRTIRMDLLCDVNRQWNKFLKSIVICEKVFQFCKCYTCASANPQHTASNWNPTIAVKNSEDCQYFVKLNNSIYNKSRNVPLALSLLPRRKATKITGIKTIWFHGSVTASNFVFYERENWSFKSKEVYRQTWRMFENFVLWIVLGK
jgi:hypothetical protein